ncbi:Mitochondrial import inner membrane translocase subunit TIM50 [Apostasia shenzhenica]|uniref:Mitochondrial import inner membrane translocase subunit TIM50 n=1 Tax=Apostasia shenzhenica TaxID=1088818 RepID=A0A2I0B9P0_9ASPA|nr:Mitochondrial import inner membrane translocase subunit TIM50 [Apostasia shenzhenica]
MKPFLTDILKVSSCVAIIHILQTSPFPDDKTGSITTDTGSVAIGGGCKKGLPPPLIPGRKTLFLDLDETLVHSQVGAPPEHYDFTVHPLIDGQEITFYVLRRPEVEELLRAAAKSYEVVVFTAGLEEYASRVLDRLDPSGEMIAHRLYRDSCREVEGGKLVKDLAGLGRDLAKVVIVDDNPGSYTLQMENAIPVAPFVDDLSGDRELQRVMRFLEFASRFEDTREAVAFFLAGEDRRPVMSPVMSSGSGIRNEIFKFDDR